MSKCLYITFSMDVPKNYLQDSVQKKARSLEIEGTAQLITKESVRIIACGGVDALQDFVDFLHQEAAQRSIEGIEIEPTLKDKDFRGVFRVIE